MRALLALIDRFDQKVGQSLPRMGIRMLLTLEPVLDWCGGFTMPPSLNSTGRYFPQGAQGIIR